MFKKIFNLFKKNNENNKAIRELHAMSDRDLADIGIRRGDIEFIIKSHAKNNG